MQICSLYRPDQLTLKRLEQPVDPETGSAAFEPTKFAILHRVDSLNIELNLREDSFNQENAHSRALAENLKSGLIARRITVKIELAALHHVWLLSSTAAGQETWIYNHIKLLGLWRTALVGMRLPEVAEVLITHGNEKVIVWERTRDEGWSIESNDRFNWACKSSDAYCEGLASTS